MLQSQGFRFTVTPIEQGRRITAFLGGVRAVRPRCRNSLPGCLFTERSWCEVFAAVMSRVSSAAQGGLRTCMRLPPSLQRASGLQNKCPYWAKPSTLLIGSSGGAFWGHCEGSTSSVNYHQMGDDLNCSGGTFAVFVVGLDISEGTQQVLNCRVPQGS